jgi:ElaB/YqjD/DUF883 family membrane-anchored ribosome-binding protein
MKQHNSDRPIQSRVPLVVLEGKRMIRTSARKASKVAGQVAREGTRIVGRTVHQTELMAKRHPWVGIGTAACTGLFFGALAAWFFTKED